MGRTRRGTLSCHVHPQNRVQEPCPHRSSATSTSIGEPARCRCVTMAIGTIEVTKNKCRLCKAQKTVLNPNPDSAAFKPGGAWCRVPIQQPPLFAQRGRSPRSLQKSAQGSNLTVAQFQHLLQCWSSTELYHQDALELHGSRWTSLQSPHRAAVIKETFFFFFFSLKPLKTC